VLSADTATTASWKAPSGGLPTGLDTGAIVYYDGADWVSSSNITYSQTSSGATATATLGVDGDAYLTMQVVDGNVLNAPKGLRVTDSKRLEFWSTSGTSRTFLYTSATGPTARLTAESTVSLANTGFIVEMPLGIQGFTGNKPTTAQGDGGKFWMSSFNPGSYKTALMWSNEDNIANPVDNVAETSYQWSTNTSSPGSNEFIKGDNALIASMTTLWAGDTDLPANDSGWFWDMVDVGDTIKLYQSSNKNSWAHFRVDSITDSTGYWTIGVTFLSRGSSTAFTNLTEIRVQFEKTSLSSSPEILYNGAESRLITGPGGDVNLRGSDNNDGSNRSYGFTHLDGTLRGEIYQTSGDTWLANYIQGGVIGLLGVPTGGGSRQMVAADPNAAVSFRYGANIAMSTDAEGIYVTRGHVRIPQIASPSAPGVNNGTYWVKENSDTTIAMFAEENGGHYTLQNTISEFSARFSNTTTAADPGAGFFRLNAGTYGSVTTMYISSYDYAVPFSAGTSATNDWVWGLAAVGDLITIRSAYDPTRYIQALITSNTDNGVWHTVGLNILTSGSAFMLNQNDCRFHIQHLSRASGNYVVDSSGIISVGPAQANITSDAPFWKFTETGVTGTPVWWWGSDGGIMSLRLNNAAPYGISFNTNAGNDTITSVSIPTALSVTGAVTGSNLNVSNWDTAFGWGNHAGLYSLLGHTHAAADIVSGLLSVNRLSGTQHTATPATPLVEFNRFTAVVDMDTIVEPGQYGGYLGMTNGPTGFTYDPFWVGASASDVSSLLVVPRTASRGLAWRGETADIVTAWHYSLWSTTAPTVSISATPAELNLLDLSGLTAGWVLSADTATTASWKAPAGGGGNVSNTGTPLDNQVAIWTNATTVEGVTGLTYNGTVLGVAGTIDLGDMTIGDGVLTDPVQIIIQGMDENDTGFVFNDGMSASWLDRASLNRIYCQNIGVGGSSGELRWSSVSASLMSFTFPIEMLDNAIRSPLLNDYAIDAVVATPSSNVSTCNYQSANTFEVPLGATSGNVTINITNPPASGNYGEVVIKVQQHATTPRTITWQGGGADVMAWPGGTAPTMSAGANAIDIYFFSTWDAGATWYGTAVQNFS